MKNFFLFLFIFSATVSIADSQIASGGNYAIEKSVIAGGGASGNTASAGGSYQIEGTAGQSAAGTKQQNGGFEFHPGFWNAAPTFVPTAAEVNVSGRVLTANGGGIRNVLVTMVKSSGESRTVLSGALGCFQFDDVAPGEIYIFSVSAKRYAFSQPIQVRSISGDTDDIIFTADNIKQILTPQIESPLP